MMVAQWRSAIAAPAVVAAVGAFLAGSALSEAAASGIFFYATGLLFTIAATTRALIRIRTSATAFREDEPSTPVPSTVSASPRRSEPVSVLSWPMHRGGSDADSSPLGAEPAPQLRFPQTALAFMSDERLAAVVSEGNEEAFALLVARYQPRLVSFCRAFVRSEVAQDVVQNVWLRVYTAITEGRPRGPFRPFLYRTARLASLDYIRRESGHAWLESLGERDLADFERTHSGPSAADVVEGWENWREALSALSDLPERERSVLVMQALEGLTSHDIASAMDLPQSTILALSGRARNALREALMRDRGVDEEHQATPTGDESSVARERASLENVDDFLREVLA